MENGKHMEHRDDDDEYTPDQLALMLTQDAAYIQMKRSVELKKIEQLRSRLHLIDVQNRPQNHRTIFVQNSKEVSKFDLSKRLNIPKEMADEQTLSTLDEEFLRSTDLPELTDVELKAARRLKQKAYDELLKRIRREEQLRLVAEKMKVKQAINKDKSIAKRVKKGTKTTAPVYKFKQVRKK
jgi:U3 small nucleolar RNA-associated protein 11